MVVGRDDDGAEEGDQQEEGEDPGHEPVHAFLRPVLVRGELHGQIPWGISF